jgi:glycosyltransferase involved in cell wall biosynthesis
LVVTLDAADNQKGFALPIPRLGPPSIEWVIATSEGADTRHATDWRNVRFIAPAVDVSQDKPISRAEICRELGVHAGARLLVAAGSGRPAERMKDLIWASDLLKCVRDDFRLALLVPEPARRGLQRFVDQCEINDLVRFAPSSLNFRQVAPHAEVFLTASLSPATELLVVAMAAGSAVVATNLLQHRGLVISGETGLLVQPRDRAGFARITRKMLDETPHRAAMAEAARREVIGHHSATRLADEYAKVYQRAIEH